MNTAKPRFSRPFSIGIGVIVLVSVALAWSPVGQSVADMLVDARVIAMPGDVSNGQSKQYFQRKWDGTVPAGYQAGIMVENLHDIQEARIETVTVTVELPAGQVPLARIATYRVDGSTVPHFLALEPQGVYFVNGGGRARFTGTHSIRVVSKAGTQLPQVTKFDWSCSRFGGTTGVMNVNMSVSGYATPAPPIGG